MGKNSHFQFKQFTIQQDQCAMKVCTDACVLGAWTDVDNADRILDIGTGTGLLSLMIAQRNTYAAIDAVEMEAEAFFQAGENVHESPFQGRIQLYHEAVQDFESEYQYDLIITNPPFFQSDLRSPAEKINQAHHAETLDFADLLNAVRKLLKPEGRFSILLPIEEGIQFKKMASEQGWQLRREMTLFHKPEKKAFRSLMEFQDQALPAQEVTEETLHIYEADGVTYDAKFKELLEDFYLKF
ncbi:tRNA1(Val) (adenine(37)-N6)-methyltransferase [Dyadobacter sp. CECT 9623]|uniref:tRNA1(Val) (adenine(37)-N6)-methyltransferase n=1 Tax=Dyadobacter linearis TaxID=2823330 RepID=A0ABN7RD31_9BACT|nr:methyltransferase [Dyadobacter sp. CECT 9623]CAG5069408.1 tRNA1(Val) (adenine(37)-N6)-methyltransferase [Dyadobacter sp. CECT 9623]